MNIENTFLTIQQSFEAVKNSYKECEQWLKEELNRRDSKRIEFYDYQNHCSISPVVNCEGQGYATIIAVFLKDGKLFVDASVSYTERRYKEILQLYELRKNAAYEIAKTIIENKL